MADIPIPLTGVDITSSYGAYQIGIVISCFLCGITTMQIYLYFFNYFDHDKWTLKGLVLFLWILDLVNLALIVGGAWKIQVSEWGRLSQVLSDHAMGMDHTEVEAVVILIVQCYLIRRIWIFNTEKTTFDYIVLGILPIMSAWQLIGDIVYQVIGLNQSLAVLSTAREVGINMSLRATAAAVDVIVTIYMVRLLTMRLSSMGFSKTKQMLYRMLLVIINTGMFTAILAIITLILLAARPSTLYYLTTEFSLCTSYLSCLLANLNSRNFVKGPEGAISVVDTTFQVAPRNLIDTSASYRLASAPSDGSWMSKSNGTQVERGDEHRVAINIHRDQVVSRDTGDYKGELSV